MNTISTAPDPVPEMIRSPLLVLAQHGKPASASLLESLLRDQQAMTAVEQFSQLHESGAEPAQARYYRDLIPGRNPERGEQFAFEVDLDSCTGCKACVSACHSLNGLDEMEVFRSVGLLQGGTSALPFQQTVTTACHHCVDPACMNGCPVKAYEKDPITGIVKHLDDQCIGCQYCTLMCPYDAPKYNAELGIVRKCDMCSDRLSGGEAPACVQACPNSAIAIRIIEQEQAIQASEAGTFLPGAPGAQETVPTTVYKTRRSVPSNILPADFYATSPEHSHPPLVAMLVLTQLAVGAFAFGHIVQRWLGVHGAAHAEPYAFFALALAVGAIAVSTMHLGRPQYAFRAFLGLRHSWLSREIIAFGLFAPLGAVYAVSSVPAIALRISEAAARWGIDPSLLLRLRNQVGVAAIGVGMLGVFCSVMVYAATKRPQWSTTRSAFKFFATTVLLGAAAVFMLGELIALRGGASAIPDPIATTLARALLGVIIGCTLVKLLSEVALLLHLRDRRITWKKRVAMVVTNDLAPANFTRFLTGGLGGLLIAGMLLGGDAGAAPASVAGRHATAGVAMFFLLLASELLERYMFFKAAPASRMPGGVP